jgi:hypothetical protein
MVAATKATIEKSSQLCHGDMIKATAISKTELEVEIGVQT